ncbi:uncharacterized protein [Montipora capricornis]|uniref:uncharacterized protein isoform X2 n=1 Tax=Montipora capricornis TaxID=246305 RepID=UPI0035F21AB5
MSLVIAESNIGLIFSTHKNCGKSLCLHVICKGQGIPVRRHLLLLSGGNQNTAGTSDKKVLEVMSKTSLVVLVDDPLISQLLGKFLNQIQSGLMQGSATFGMQAPKASLLISSNSKEVERVAGRVIRFNYTWDEAHSDNEGGRETQLLDFMDNNKIHASANKVLDIKGLLSKIAALNAAKQERPPFFWRIQQDALDKLNQDGPGKVQYVVVENEIIV